MHYIYGITNALFVHMETIFGPSQSCAVSFACLSSNSFDWFYACRKEKVRGKGVE
jgi:hypothetical protein